MTASFLTELAVQSVKDPARAARRIIDMNVPSAALWTGLTLMAVLNTLMFVVSNMLMPGPSMLPGAFNMPVFYFGFVMFGLILIVYSIFWTGKALGGTGTLHDVMALVVWLQGLRVVVQAATVLLLLTIPLLSAILVFVAGILGLWILVHFVKEAHGYGSLGQAAGVLIAAFFAMVLGLSLLLTFLGAGSIGSASYV